MPLLNPKPSRRKKEREEEKGEICRQEEKEDTDTLGSDDTAAPALLTLLKHIGPVLS